MQYLVALALLLSAAGTGALPAKPGGTAAGAGGTGTVLQCLKICEEQFCTHLSGNLTAECGGCPATARCNPKGVDFDTWHQRKGEHLVGEIYYKVECLTHCDVKEGCIALHGNLTMECGACPVTTSCNPKAEHFDTWPERAKKKEL